jgi:hypothetical protein
LKEEVRSCGYDEEQTGPCVRVCVAAAFSFFSHGIDGLVERRTRQPSPLDN